MDKTYSRDVEIYGGFSFKIPVMRKPFVEMLARVRVIVAIGVLSSCVVTPAHADCGDDVGGVRVACACGDVVVTDTRLEPGDPVVSAACPSDALMVRAVAGAESIVVDLNGLEIRGQGSGVGVRVIDGGRRGAVVIGGTSAEPGVVTGFREGIRAGRPGSLASLSHVIVNDSRRHGIVVRGDGTRLESLETSGNAGDGVRALGRAVELHDVAGAGNAGRDLRDRTRATAVKERAAGRSRVTTPPGESR